MKKLFTLLGAIALTLNMMAVNVWDGSSEPWTNGSGTATDPYLIETASNLAYLAEKVNEGYQAEGMAVFRYTYFMMTDDFDLNNINWTPIGNVNMSMEGYYFAGVFDGWYHNIDHLSIQSNADVCALFGGLGGYVIGNTISNGIVMHLSVTNGSITTTGTGAAGIVGGIAGNARVIQCSFSGTISVNNSGSYCGAGGIVALAAAHASIEQCSFYGSINAANTNFMGAAGAGGIVGIAMDTVFVNGCYNSGSVTGNALMMSVAAGIVGATLQENEIAIWNCYNVGTVNAITKGGIFGMISPINPTKNETSLEIMNCYYLSTCGGTTNYGISKTSDEMKTEEFKDLLNGGCPYAFVMDNGTNNGYPIHALSGMILWDAAEITDHSAKLSANLHEGNNGFVRAVFVCQKWDVNGTYEPFEVEVEADDYVEIVLEDLEPNTSYIFWIYTECTDGHIVDGGVLGGYCRGFTTEEYDAVDDFSNPVKVYPNPATDFIRIDGVEVSEVRIYNVIGQLLKTIKASNEIVVSDLPGGCYLLNIIDTEGKLTKRISEKVY